MRRSRSRLAYLGLLVLAALTIRCWRLGAAGFSEDEIVKLRAVEAYRRLDFSANAEHPMLMKLAALASTSGAEALNRAVLDERGASITPEAALRFPNALAGALTTAVIFLLADALFGAAVGWWAAVLWAFDVNAVAISRIGKEDSLLLLFLITAAWCYERGKRSAPAPRAYSAAGQRWFAAAGAAFGLMTAAKYMPYFFGLHALYCRVADPHPGLNRPDKPRYYGWMAAAFLAANFAILLPQNWGHLLRYTAERLLDHTGYVFAGSIYVNQLSATPWGVPWYYYLVFLATKVPVVLLLAMLAGLAATVRQPRVRGFVFLRVFLVFILLPYSLVASKFVRYTVPLLAILDMIAAVGIVRVMEGIRVEPRGRRAAAAAAIAGVVLAGPAAALAESAPYYALYRNTLSRRVAGDALLFPHCELYDAGMREAVRLVASRARAGATVVSEAPRVVREYASRLRGDLHVETLTHDGIHRSAEVWVLVQDGRIYYENLPLITMLRTTRRMDAEVRVGGVSAVQLYRLAGAGTPPSSRDTGF